MAKKGKHRQVKRITLNLIARRENQMYYQNGSSWKQPSSPRELAVRRTLEKS